MKKSICYFIAFVVAVLCGVTVLAAADAEAQDPHELFFIEEFTKVEEIEFNGEPELKLSFNHHGEELSFYWAPEEFGEEYDFTKLTWVEIMFGDEVVNSGYVEIIE